jgi:membrane protein insertase Oxa1/YidC/SpoIIIJ
MPMNFEMGKRQQRYSRMTLLTFSTRTPYFPDQFLRHRASQKTTVIPQCNVQQLYGPGSRIVHPMMLQLSCCSSISPLNQIRSVSSLLPEVVQNFSVWGGTGVVIKSLHNGGGLPYWACFSAMNFLLRASLIPLVIHSAKMAARYAKVAPEVQFIITLFQNDLKKMRAEGKSLYEQRFLFLQNLQTLRAIYKLHNINPLTVFFSPLLQIPFFYYVATDLRKIVNGADPTLAQELTESKFLWITDLTDPDPWYGLPIAAGAMLYINVEVAIGKKSLSGPTASQSDFARLLKDLFQSLAVFMPSFASQSPAGLQIYLVSSFSWTLFQSAALRNDAMRSWVGLPAMGTPPTEPKYAKEFMEFKKLEQKAKEIRGDGPILGRNVLAVGFETSFPGTKRPSTIQGSGSSPPGDDTLEGVTSIDLPQSPRISMEQASAAWGGQFIHGISAPMKELEERIMTSIKEEKVKEIASQKFESELGQYMSQPTVQDMKAANLGVRMVPPSNKNKSSVQELDSKRFKQIKSKKSSSLKGRRK